MNSNESLEIGFTEGVKGGLILVEAELDSIFLGPKADPLRAAANIVFSGGKRLRPALTLICGQSPNADGRELVSTACAVELIHTASLIHDDVLDKAVKRRGVHTINYLYGDQAAIAAGDYLLGLAFESIARVGNPQVLRELSGAALSLSQGEIAQANALFDTTQTVDDYLARSEKKTAALFAAACFCGASIAGASKEEAGSVKSFGQAIGVAFQIYDDILDITAGEEELGKPVGIDIKEGVITLPIIYALAESERAEDLQRVIKDVNSTDDKVLFALELVKATSAIKRAEEMAVSFVESGLKALSALPDNDVKRLLVSIGNFVCSRH